MVAMRWTDWPTEIVGSHFIAPATDVVIDMRRDVVVMPAMPLVMARDIVVVARGVRPGAAVRITITGSAVAGRVPGP